MTLQFVVSKLEEDKSKLEGYARKTLSAFKDKYMNLLKAMEVSPPTSPQQQLSTILPLLRQKLQLLMLLSSIDVGREKDFGGPIGRSYSEE